MPYISVSANASRDGESDFEPGFYAPIDVPLLVLCVLIILANSLVVMLFAWKQSLRTPSNVFLASVAVSDGVSSAFGVPLLIACSATTSEAACVPTAIFLRFSAVCTMLHLLIIAFDRYSFIVQPLKYPSCISYSRAALPVSFAYITSLIVALIQLLWLDFGNVDVNEDAKNQVLETEKRYFISCLVLFFFIPVVMASFSYGRIFVISVRHNRAILRQRGELGFIRALVRCIGSLVLCAMLLIFIICWLPYFVLGLQHHMGNEFFVLPIWFEHLMVFLRFTPALTNPILCTFFKQDFRQVLKLCLIRRYAPNREMHQRWRIVYNTTPQSSRVVSTTDFSDYSKNRIVHETIPSDIISSTSITNSSDPKRFSTDVLACSKTIS